MSKIKKASTVSSYPPVFSLSIKKPVNPNKFYAFPLLGILAKLFILIPILIALLVLYVFSFLIMVLNSFYVLFNGKFWKFAYGLYRGIINWQLQTTFFLFGLTDKYIGVPFASSASNVWKGKFGKDMKANLKFPKSPNRLFAIPLFGGLARILLLTPFFIYKSVVSYGSLIGVAFSSFPVLFNGRYPESTYELARDALRLSMSAYIYMYGLADNYPNFSISMRNQGIKIFLIALGAVWFLLDMIFRLGYR